MPQLGTHLLFVVHCHHPLMIEISVMIYEDPQAVAVVKAVNIQIVERGAGIEIMTGRGAGIEITTGTGTEEGIGTEIENMIGTERSTEIGRGIEIEKERELGIGKGTGTENEVMIMIEGLIIPIERVEGTLKGVAVMVAPGIIEGVVAEVGAGAEVEVYKQGMPITSESQVLQGAELQRRRPSYRAIWRN